jgi:hypothetical protein
MVPMDSVVLRAKLEIFILKDGSVVDCSVCSWRAAAVSKVFGGRGEASLKGLEGLG